MNKVLLIENISSPYSVDLFYYMQKKLRQYEFFVLYTSRAQNNREWEIDNTKLANSIYTESKVLRIRTKLDYRYIHIPTNIFECLNKINPDIVIAWEYNLAAIQSTIWCKKYKKKYISATEGTLLTEQNLWQIQKWTRKYISKHSDAFLVCGTKAKEKVLSWGIDSSKIFTGLLTVDISPYLKAERKSQNNRVLYVGSITKRKGVDLLIKSLPFLKKDYALHIVGNGRENDLKELKRLSESYGVSNKIKWCGFLSGDDLIKEYSEASVFVLPTREDCFGLVLLEALAARVPIVSSIYADGAYDIVEPEKNGIMVDPYNTKEMARAIDYILKNPQINKEWAAKSLTIVKKFEFAEVVKGYQKAIEYACSKKETYGD